jgi:hypothetical protein
VLETTRQEGRPLAGPAIAATIGAQPPTAAHHGRAPPCPPKSTIVRMWILHNRVTLGPYITDTRARTRHWSSTNHRNPKKPPHDSSRRYYICRLRVHVTPFAVDVGSLACLLLAAQMRNVVWGSSVMGDLDRETSVRVWAKLALGSCL